MGKLLENKGLFFSTFALVLFFLVYLLINFVVQSQALNDSSYADKFSNLAPQFVNGTQSDQLLDELRAFQNGNGELVAIDEFLFPDNSNIDDVISTLSSGQVSEAKTAFDNLSATVQRQKDRKLNLIKLLQIAAAIISLLMYALVVLPFIARVTQSKETEVEVKRETEGIMSTVSEGLFLLNHEHDIGVEQSASLKGMFKSERDLEGNFFDFIGQYVPQNTLQIAKDYLDLLFGDRVKEKLVKDLNPLNEVEINIVRRDGSYENRYLDFNFNRVMQDGQLSHVLGSVTDVTRRVMLQKELEETKEEQEAQLELLLSILHVDNAQLSVFFENADSSLNEINQTLEERGYGNREIRSKVTEISRTVHRLKGDSAALGLHKFEFAAHALEDELQTVTKEHANITGKELLPAITKLKDMFAELDNMRSLVGKFSSELSIMGTSDGSSDAAAVAEGTVTTVVPKDSLQQLVATVTQRTGKRAALSTFGMQDGEIPEHLEEAVNSIVVQLIRNSIVHGCLEPEQRVELGKSDFMNITSSFSKTDNGYQLIVRDDGEGFDEEKIIKKAVDLELISTEEADKLEPGQAVKLAFKPGFSALDEVEMDGGRGVGLDVVHEMVKELGGSVFVQQKQGHHCQFKILIPKTN
ncbi:MAG: Hpt domain-containing protein [Acidiferrobacterales bacterium]|nr:Hpt domain-containing protein [Acidiferrobacterales bacterium]